MSKLSASLSLVIIALLLAGCFESKSEQKARIEKDLPSGCTVRDLGSYGPITNLVAIICDGRASSAANYHEEYTHCSNAGKEPVCDTDAHVRATLWVKQ